MPVEVEAVVWCPKCRVAKYDVRRIPTGADGVYYHDAQPAEAYVDAQARGARCECGELLERKNG